MRITLELSNKDLRYFRDALKQFRAGKKTTDEDVVIQAATDLKEEALASDPPDFVKDRIGGLDILIKMLEDKEWRLAGADRARILNALAYFADPDDLIPDRIPGLGYLDDAIMLDLVLQDLKHEIEAYEHFCEYRKERKPDADALAKRRDNLQARMRRRRRADRDKIRTRRGSGRNPLRLW